MSQRSNCLVDQPITILCQVLRHRPQDWQHCLVIWPIYPDVFFAQFLVFLAEKRLCLLLRPLFSWHIPQDIRHASEAGRDLCMSSTRGKKRDGLRLRWASDPGAERSASRGKGADLQVGWRAYHGLIWFNGLTWFNQNLGLKKLIACWFQNLIPVCKFRRDIFLLRYPLDPFGNF